MNNKEINETVKQIEMAYRNDNKRWNKRIIMIHPDNIRETMLKHKIGLQCEKCLGKETNARYCSQKHATYYRSITDNFYGTNIPYASLNDQAICPLCEEKIHEKNSIDHIQPITKGGLEFDRNNLQWACLTCNLKKKNHTKEELAEKEIIENKQTRLSR